MITLHSPNFVQSNSNVYASIQVDMGSLQNQFPREIWFTFEDESLATISNTIDPFLMILIPIAMFHNKNIRVEGSISSRLYENLQSYMDIFCFFEPSTFSKIEISANLLTIITNSHNKNGAVLPFSGGIDSFYTLWKHLPQNQLNKNFQIHHSFFLHGFDIPRTEIRTYKIAKKAYSAMMSRYNIGFTPVTTNAREFVYGLEPDWISHSLIVATGHFFSTHAGYTYLSEDNTPDYMPPFSTQRLFVPLLSTETMQAISVGGNVSKLERIETIAEWPETYNKLRICYKKPDGLQNCGRCRKCALGMSALDMIGKLERYKTFSLPIDKKEFRKNKYNKETYLAFPRDWLGFAKKHKKKDWERHYRYVFLKNKIEVMCVKLSGGILSSENENGYLYQLLFQLSAKLKKCLPVYSSALSCIKNLKSQT